MLVALQDDNPRTDPAYMSQLQAGVKYRVIGIEYGSYRIKPTDFMPSLYPVELFVIVDGAVEREWVVSSDSEGNICVGFPELLRQGFWEDILEGDEESAVELEHRLSQLKIA